MDANITNAHCLVLKSISQGFKTVKRIAPDLKKATATVHDQCIRMKELGLVVAGERTKEGIEYIMTARGKKVLNSFVKGKMFKRTVSTPTWVDRAPKKAPEYTWGVVFEDHPVRKMPVKFVPHAVSMPWKGRENLAE